MNIPSSRIVASTVSTAVFLVTGTPVLVPYLDGRVGPVYGFMVAPALALLVLVLTASSYRGTLRLIEVIEQARSAIRFQRVGGSAPGSPPATQNR